jgi:hypothetical protein
MGFDFAEGLRGIEGGGGRSGWGDRERGERWGNMSGSVDGGGVPMHAMWFLVGFDGYLRRRREKWMEKSAKGGKMPSSSVQREDWRSARKDSDL